MRERLHLLEHDLDELPGRLRPTRRCAGPGAAIASGVLTLDDLAFDDFWRLDEGSLNEALHATPAVRFRVGEGRLAEGHRRVFDHRPGRTATGYLQRVAVHPEARRRGWGRALVLDSLRWLRRHDARRALVNTQWTNDGALALYESCGFRRLPVGLCVLDRSL